MAAKRIGAALLAIALVIGAILVRRHLDDSSSSATTASTPAGAAVTLTCVTDFEDLCTAVAAKDASVTVAVESYAATIAKIKAGNAPQLWLTVDPLQSASTLGASTPVAESTMIAVTTASQAPYTADCPAASATWKCIGDLTGSTLVPAGYLDPRKSVIGLAAMGALAGGYLTATNVGIDAIPDALPDELQAWLSAIERSSARNTMSGSTSAVTAIGARASAIKLAVTTQADFHRFALAKASSLAVTTPAPAATARVVLAHASSTTLPPSLVPALTKAFTDVGWDAPTSAPTNLPSNAQVFTLLPTLGGLK